MPLGRHCSIVSVYVTRRQHCTLYDIFPMVHHYNNVCPCHQVPVVPYEVDVGCAKTFAIRNPAGKTLYEIDEVIPVWKDHFSNLCTNMAEDGYDQEHYANVTRQVKLWSQSDDVDEFLIIPFNDADVRKCIMGLNKGKSAGFDSVTAEHLQNTGDKFVTLLTQIFNRIITLEFIPRNFRIGTQVPLYKGKNTCSLDPNNYRGITLLTSLNKVFEMLMWSRLKGWWFDEHVISPLQGACRPGMSCLHTALCLQETIAVSLDSTKKVFVAYFDVSKAFDGVWIDGLFFQMRKMGIVGKVWRLLYLSYQIIWCKVRINGQYSDWYKMECGIHQGGYLSLLKYTAFIDPLLREIETSGIGCCISSVPTSPLGYADDMAMACLSKPKIDSVLRTVYTHSLKWRYRYNAAKSAVMIYGETRRENAIGKKHRMFKLGPQKVPEKCSYDHVGVKNYLFGDFTERIEERISKGRRCFNAMCSLGVRKGGVTMRTCAILFWSVVIPVSTYVSELWVLKPHETELLRKFQRQVGRRCQRFPDRSPNYSAYAPLGWLSIDKFIQVKKLLFVRTMSILDDSAVCKKILIVGTQKYIDDVAKCKINANNSPIFDILKVAESVGLLVDCINMIMNGHFYSKEDWRRMVWQAIWKCEDEDYLLMYKQPKPDIILFNVIDNAYYLLWWHISDLMPQKTKMCKILASIVCDTSLLKATDYRIKRKSYASKMCVRCELGITENARHLILQCPFYNAERTEMFNEIESVSDTWSDKISNQGYDILHILLGMQPDGISYDEMICIWLIAGSHISRMYQSAIAGRI